MSSRPPPEWSASPIEDDEPLTIAENPLDGQIPTDSMIHAPEVDDSDIATLHHRLDEFPAPQEEEEALTTLMPLGPTEKAALEAAARVTPTSNAPPAPEASPGAMLLYVGLAIGAIAAVGLLAYGIVRFLGAEEEGALPARSDDAGLPVLAEPATRELHVESEPAGAVVYVDGVRVGGVTPLTASLPSGTEQVWLRLELDGYFDQERQVLASVGEARFVLARIEGLEDAGVEEDAAVEGDPDAGEPDGGPAVARPRRIRRPPRRRRPR